MVFLVRKPRNAKSLGLHQLRNCFSGNLLGAALNAVGLQSSDYAEYYGRAYNDYYQSRVDVEG
jgi:hypothetical protein